VEKYGISRNINVQQLKGITYGDNSSLTQCNRPRLYFSVDLLFENIYTQRGDLSGRCSEIDGRWQGTTGRSRPLPFTSPGIIVLDEKNIS